MTFHDNARYYVDRVASNFSKVLNLSSFPDANFVSEANVFSLEETMFPQLCFPRFDSQFTCTLKVYSVKYLFRMLNASFTVLNKPQERRKGKNVCSELAVINFSY